MRVRELIVDLHAWLGAIAALFILAASLSGVAIAFSGPLMHAETGAFGVSGGTAQPVDAEALDQMLAKAQAEAGPTFMPLGYLGQNAEIVTDAVMIYGMSDMPENGGETQIVTFDPATGEVLGQLFLDRTITHELIDFHANLLMGDFGAIWVAIIGIVMTALALAGLYQWWPVRGSAVKKMATVRLGKGLPRQSWKLHSLSGFWLSIAIMAWALTGVYWSQPQWTPAFMPETSALPAEVEQEWSGRQCSSDVSSANALDAALGLFSDAALFEAEFAAPWQGYHVIHLTRGTDFDLTDGDIRVWVHASCEGVIHLSDVAQGAVLEKVGASSAAIHSGRSFGWLRVPLVTLVGLALILLSITGLHQWWRRVRRK